MCNVLLPLKVLVCLFNTASMRCGSGSRDVASLESGYAGSWGISYLRIRGLLYNSTIENGFALDAATRYCLSADLYMLGSTFENLNKFK